MTPIDEAALKAGISDSEIMEIAGRWFHTGENQHRADGYYYRSLGTPTNVRGSDLIAFARALLSSHHEDGGRAEPVWCSCGDGIMPDTGAKCGVCASGVALGGEKGEAVDMRAAFWAWVDEQGCDTDGAWSAWQGAWNLRAAPVGKARMLTEAEADHITGMHNTGRAQGDSECAEAIQRKFCEVNGITLQGGA